MNKINIERIVSPILDENTYIVYKNGRGFIVDAGCDVRLLDKKIADSGIIIEAVLLTHGHFDHCMQAKYYKDKGVKIYIGEMDADKLSTKKNLSLSMYMPFEYTTADVLLKDGDKLNIADIDIKVMATPGHSKGGVSYIIDEAGAIFVGDTVFKLSYGRTDFPDGNFGELIESFRKLFALDKDYTLYTGHGDKTTLFYEKRNNPITLEADL